VFRKMAKAKSSFLGFFGGGGKNFQQELQWRSVERKEMMTKWIMIDIFANGKRGKFSFSDRNEAGELSFIKSSLRGHFECTLLNDQFETPQSPTAIGII